MKGSYDAVALASYLYGKSYHERVRLLLDAERRSIRWTIALGDRPDTQELLECNALTLAIRKQLMSERAPMVIWSGDDLAA
jgi:hypothetical protein